MVKLESERLLIRHYLASDLEDLHGLISDKANMQLVEDVFSNSVEETFENLSHVMKNEDGQYFAIYDKKSLAFIGSVGYTYSEPGWDDKTAHLGYFILPKFHGKGIVTEAVKKVLEFAFEIDNCVQITTGCYKEHIASERVMIKSGFRKRSERIGVVQRDGTVKDRVEYAIDIIDYLKVDG